jgi:hypothetical protein
MPWVDYKKLRTEVSIERVIADHGYELRGSGDQRKCMCPASCCREPRERTLSVNIVEGVFKCWKCDVKGNVIDFEALVSDRDPIDTKQFRQAALALQERYAVRSEKPENPSRTDGKGKVHRRAAKTADGKKRNILTNEPLDFELKNLDAGHESVTRLNLKPETVAHFGPGYCERRGMLQGRIAFPLFNAESKVIGYGGLLPDPRDATDEKPLYRYPEGERKRTSDDAVLRFDRSLLLYGETDLTEQVDDLMIVALPHQLWYLRDRGLANSVCLMTGNAENQRKLMIEKLSATGQAWFLIDRHDHDARAVLGQVARTHAVHWLPCEDTQAVLARAKNLAS